MYDRIDPIQRTLGTVGTQPVARLNRVDRENPAGDRRQRERREPEDEDPSEDDGHPHVDVLV